MLELSGVSKTYGDHRGVEDVSIVAPDGSRTVIVGPSGSGKTTLLRLIAGFEAPDAGTIRLGGRVLDGVPPHRRNIAYVQQEGALFPHMSVADNVGFAIPRHAEDRARRIDELLARVGLSSAFGERRPHELSGGQQQRVALARALAQQPELMLLDEPFSALDTGLREAMRTMVGDVLDDAHIASVLVTHDQAEALAFADHLVVMRDAVVADAGPPQRLYERPADIEVARFLGEAIVLPAEVKDGVARTALGTVPVRHGDASAATVLVRPEQVQIGAPTDGEGALGHILHRAYRGAQWRLEVECRQGGLSEPFFVDVPAALDFKPGDVVRLRLGNEAHVFPQRLGASTRP
jgi:iron(III) transport system ATP-binding protein